MSGSAPGDGICRRRRWRFNGKTAALRQLTPEESLRLYRALWERARHLFNYSQPSPMVQRVQIVFLRYLEAQQRESS